MYRAQSFTSLNADFHQKEIKVKGGVLMEHYGFFGNVNFEVKICISSYEMFH